MLKIFYVLNDGFNLLKNVPTLIHMENKELIINREVADIAKPEELQLILSEAKDRVAETAKSKEIYVQRSLVLIGIALTTLTGIIGYFGVLGKNFSLTALNLNLIVIALIMLYISCKLKNNLKPVNFTVNGTLPEKLYSADFFINQPKSAEFMMLHNLIKDYHERFYENQSVNKGVLVRLDDCIEWLYRIPALSFLIWVVGIIFQLDFFS